MASASACGEPVTDVDGHQPQLVEAELVETAQDRVVIGSVGAVARDHFVAGGPQFVGQQREAADRPSRRDCW